MAANIPHNVFNAMIACGIDNVAAFQGHTQAERIAADIFDDTFATGMEITFKGLDKHSKTYSELSLAQGQIRTPPGRRKNMMAFIQWTRDEIRLGRDTSFTSFPLEQVSDCLRRYKTHKRYVTDVKTLADKRRRPKSLMKAQSGRIGSLPS
jgi:hypothetical protein